MNKLFLTIGFVIMTLAQWFVPSQMIFTQEKALTEGTAYKFKTRPVDPSDPFRGKYIFLQYEMNKVATEGQKFERGDEVFVYIETDAEGFAKATKASKNRLEISQDYIKTTASYSYADSIHFNLPFTTFYMEEGKAYDAEIAVREVQRNRDSLAPVCYGLVYIKDNVAVLDNVFIGGKSIKEFVEEEQSKSPTN